MGSIIAFLVGIFVGFVICTGVVVILFDDQDENKHLQ